MVFVLVGACLLMTWFTYVMIRSMCGSWLVWVSVGVELVYDRGWGGEVVCMYLVSYMCICVCPHECACTYLGMSMSWPESICPSWGMVHDVCGWL